jgi:hypothetical protein
MWFDFLRFLHFETAISYCWLYMIWKYNIPLSFLLQTNANFVIMRRVSHTSTWVSPAETCQLGETSSEALTTLVVSLTRTWHPENKCVLATLLTTFVQRAQRTSEWANPTYGRLHIFVISIHTYAYMVKLYNTRVLIQSWTTGLD